MAWRAKTWATERSIAPRTMRRHRTERRKKEGGIRARAARKSQRGRCAGCQRRQTLCQHHRHRADGIQNSGAGKTQGSCSRCRRRPSGRQAHHALQAVVRSCRAVAVRLAAAIRSGSGAANAPQHHWLDGRRGDRHPHRQRKPHQNQTGQGAGVTQGLQQHGADYGTKLRAATSAKSGNP